MSTPGEQRTAHWNTVYGSRPEESLSWHQPAPTLSLALIRRFAAPGSSVLDVGGGSSTLAGALAAEGFSPCTVLDISETALQHARERIAPTLRDRIQWRVADVLDNPDLPAVDLWHDRAVFHFLTTPEERSTYAALAARTVTPGGHLIVGTFALDGPQKCSGLPVQRYDAATLAAQFAPAFRLIHEDRELHTTPAGAAQPFTYAVLQRT